MSQGYFCYELVREQLPDIKIIIQRFSLSPILPPYFVAKIQLTDMTVLHILNRQKQCLIHYMSEKEKKKIAELAV